MEKEEQKTYKIENKKLIELKDSSKYRHFRKVNGKRVAMSEKEYADFDNGRKPTLKQIQEKKIKIRKRYLRETDWYALRSLDTGEYPEEIKNERILKRQEINKIELCDSMNDINEFK